MTARKEAPTVFGERMMFIVPHWWGIKLGPLWGIVKREDASRGGFCYQAEINGDKSRFYKSPQAAARYIERKLTQLKKQLERMGA